MLLNKNTPAAALQVQKISEPPAVTECVVEGKIGLANQGFATFATQASQRKSRTAPLTAQEHNRNLKKPHTTHIERQVHSSTGPPYSEKG
jgi:hypothetical protein